MKKYIILLIFSFICISRHTIAEENLDIQELLERISSIVGEIEEDMAVEELEYKIVHDTIRDTTYIHISSLDDVTRTFGMSYDEYVRTFINFKKKQDPSDILPVDKIYFNHFLPLLKDKFMTYGFTVKYKNDQVMLEEDEFPKVDALQKIGYKIDYMLIFYGDTETNSFLNSPTQIKSCLFKLFEKIYNSEISIHGINFYFPDYNFNQKRAMAQFIKSASLIIDNSKIDKFKLSLYASFNEKKILSNEGSYINCIAQMVDSVFVIKDVKGDTGLEIARIYDKSNSMNISLGRKIINQFYLARFNLTDHPIMGKNDFSVEKIYILIDSDYEYNTWERYFFVLIITVVLIIIFIFLYWLSPTISYYTNKNMDYIYSLLIMLFLEIILLLGCMVEFMSKEDVFSMGTESRYGILLLPFLFIFIIPMMKTVSRKKNLP